jgi:hypothetical protein
VLAQDRLCSRLRHTRHGNSTSESSLFLFRNKQSKSDSQVSSCTNPDPFLRALLTVIDGGDPRMAVDGHGHAMTIADYIALGTLIVLAIWAVAKLYL